MTRVINVKCIIVDFKVLHLSVISTRQLINYNAITNISLLKLKTMTMTLIT